MVSFFYFEEWSNWMEFIERSVYVLGAAGLSL